MRNKYQKNMKLKAVHMPDWLTDSGTDREADSGRDRQIWLPFNGNDDGININIDINIDCGSDFGNNDEEQLRHSNQIRREPKGPGAARSQVGSRRWLFSSIECWKIVNIFATALERTSVWGIWSSSSAHSTHVMYLSICISICISVSVSLSASVL